MGLMITEALRLLRDRLETERFGSSRSRRQKGQERSVALSATMTGSPKAENEESAETTEAAAASSSAAEEKDAAEEGKARPENGTQRRSASSSETKKAAEPCRYIPKEIRRAVYDRDRGRCTYQDPRTGRRCSSPRVQFHHIKPWSMGGDHSVDNLTLRCKAHNDLAAEHDLGGSAFRKRARAMADRQLPLCIG
jgi:5-methylcytosine-specific restriction endonuclease McrA